MRWMVVIGGLALTLLSSVFITAAVAVGMVRGGDMVAFIGQDGRFEAGLRMVDVNTGVQFAFGNDAHDFILPNPAWSPDGDLLFAAADINANNAQRAGIFRLDPETNTFTPIPYERPNPSATLTEMIPSPDGQYIAYLLNEATDNHVMLMRADGSNPRQISTGTDDIHSRPEWSLDSKRLAYFSRGWTRGAWNTLHVAHVDDETAIPIRVVDAETAVDFMAWSSLGVVYNQRERGSIPGTLQVYDPIAREHQPLIPGRQVRDYTVASAPGGDRIALVTFSYTEQLTFKTGEVNLYDPATGALRLLYETTSPISAVNWSADGDHLMLSLAPLANRTAQLVTQNEVVIIYATTGEERLRFTGIRPAWRP